MNKIDVLSKLNPQMKAILAKEDELAGDANDTSCGFEQMRINYVASRQYWLQDKPEMAKVEDKVLKGSHGDLTVRFFYPTPESLTETTPAIVYSHGGGWCLGNIETHDRMCRVLAQKSRAIVVSVDYHLSPEVKFPVAIQEVAFVASYLHEHGAEFSIDTENLSFAGDSAGGHTSLAAYLYLREEKGSASFIKTLLLFYGCYGLYDSVSHRIYGGKWDGLTEADWDWYMNIYFKNPEDLKTNRYANLFLNDLTHDMPACYIAAAEFDPLIDDSECLASILDEAGIEYRYEVFEGTIHAFLHYTRVLDDANDALQHAASFMNTQLGRTQI